MSVFISHATDDRAAADRIVAALEGAGIGCWVAHRDIAPGATYSESIIDALDGASAFVVIVSAAAERSPHVLREVEHAASHRTRLLPVRIDATPLGKSMRYFLGTSQWIDAANGLGEVHLAALVGALAVPKPPPHRPDAAAVAPAPTVHPPLPQLTLRVVSGPDKGLQVNLPHQRILVGRGNDAHVQLSDKAIARVHFGLEWDAAAGVFTIQGFQALNPILINNVVLKGTKPLAPGDRVAAGRTVMVLEPAAAGATNPDVAGSRMTPG